jgi:hypothetical protein
MVRNVYEAEKLMQFHQRRIERLAQDYWKWRAIKEGIPPCSCSFTVTEQKPHYECLITRLLRLLF